MVDMEMSMDLRVVVGHLVLMDYFLNDCCFAMTLMELATYFCRVSSTPTSVHLSEVTAAHQIAEEEYWWGDGVA